MKLQLQSCTGFSIQDGAKSANAADFCFKREDVNHCVCMYVLKSQCTF